MFSWSPSTSSATLQSIKSLSPSTSSFGRNILGNLTQSTLYHSLTSLDKSKLWSRFYVDDEENVQRVLDVVSDDQRVITNPRANRRRRTVVVTRSQGQSFGFTLQTYLLRRKGDELPIKVTYIDYVQLESPAAAAGIRAGDVIISINGRVVTDLSHSALIELIFSCNQMRMVVIFENIRERVELVGRAIRLRKLLNDKLYQLNLLDIEEQKILNKAYMNSLTRHQATPRRQPVSLSSIFTSSISSTNSTSSSQTCGTRSDVYDRSMLTASDKVICITRTATTPGNAVKKFRPLSYQSSASMQQLKCRDGPNDCMQLDTSSLSSLDANDATNHFVRSSTNVSSSEHFDSVALHHVIRLENTDDSYMRVFRL